MTYSPLTDLVRRPTGLYNGKRKWSSRPPNVRINGLNVHHWADTTMSGYRRLVESSDPASANYILFDNGTLVGSVPEEYRAWTTSSYDNDKDKITVEIQNSTGAPSWRISDKAMHTLIRLYADLAERHSFPATRSHIKGHQEYGVATACPGPYLLPRLDNVARSARTLNEKDWFTMASKSELRALIREEVDSVARDVMMYRISVGGATKRHIERDETNAASLLRYGGAAVFESRDQHAEVIERLEKILDALKGTD